MSNYVASPCTTQYTPTRPPILAPHDVVPIVRELVPESEKREHLIALYLDTRSVLMDVRVISIGTLGACMVEPASVYRPAIEMGASAVIVAHNHPSGDPSPSTQDVTVTQRLGAAGVILGIEFIDHIVVGANLTFASIRHLVETQPKG